MNSDKYNHWLGDLLAFINGCDFYAITLGQTTYYSTPKWYVDAHPMWRAHEDKHKEQWALEGWKFAVKYVWYNVTKGFEKNPYEIAAGPVK